MPVNNITRLLDAKRIPYTVYELPKERLGARETARLLGVEPSRVYKTIVVLRLKGKAILAVIPGDHQVDLKRLAAVLGEKKLTLPSERQAEDLTGLQAGGISPLALLNKGFQVVIASTAEAAGLIHVSAGQRGLNIKLPADALLQVTNARFADISSLETGA